MRYGMFLHDMGNEAAARPWLEAALLAYKRDANIQDYEKDWVDKIESRIR
jgi:hypothetical protein